MSKILFVCQGNVGRSQIAEGILNSLKNEDVAFSAGIDDVGEKYDYRPYKPIVDIMRKHYGIDISGQRVKQLQREHIQNIDKIIVLCKPEECSNDFPDFWVNHPGYLYHPIKDPNNQGEEKIYSIVEQIYDLIQRELS